MSLLKSLMNQRRTIHPLNRNKKLKRRQTIENSVHFKFNVNYCYFKEIALPEYCWHGDAQKSKKKNKDINEIDDMECYTFASSCVCLFSLI